eukprot:5385647-Prorocentrum_lima.AAC.1
MTSSLVGSEMCIRDRPKGGLRPLLISGTLRRLALRALMRLHKEAVSKGCLLYTSDAADDM